MSWRYLAYPADYMTHEDFASAMDTMIFGPLHNTLAGLHLNQPAG